MTKKSQWLHIMFIMCLSATPLALADALTIPHIFQSGTPASAAAVNENFSAVKSAVSKNSADVSALKLTALPSVYDGAGQRLGTFLGVMSVLTDQYYYYQVDTNGKMTGQQSFFYISPDCSGALYVGHHSGMVFYLAVIDKIYYTDRTAAIVPITVRSFRNTLTGGCSALGVPYEATHPLAIPNDPAVTGVSSATFQLPLTIGQ